MTKEPIPPNKKLLIVEDAKSLAITYQAYLKHSAYEIDWVDSLADARLFIEAGPPSLVLLDIELPDGNGLDLLREISAKRHPTQVVVMTAHGSSDIADDSILHGAFDYLTKPFTANRLLLTLRNADKHHELVKKVSAFRSIERDQYLGLVGSSIVMQSLYRTIDSLAFSSSAVLFVGEAGSGKRLAAEATHASSNRADEEFKVIDCSAGSKGIAEIEIREQHEGAERDSGGKGEILNVVKGTTLFFKEICDLNLDAQKKLLALMQSGNFQNRSADPLEQADVRILCSTSKNPLDEVRSGRFDEELYFRLNAILVPIPPLRERENDILLIAQALLEQISQSEEKQFDSFTRSAEIALRSYGWPGNIRELERCIRSVVVAHSGSSVTEDMIPDSIRQAAMPVAEDVPRQIDSPLEQQTYALGTSQIEPLWKTEKRAIQDAITLCDGNIIKAASLLELAPSTIYRKLQAWIES